MCQTPVRGKSRILLRNSCHIQSSQMCSGAYKRHILSEHTLVGILVYLADIFVLLQGRAQSGLLLPKMILL